MDTLTSGTRRYADHLGELRQRYDEALAHTGFDAVVVGAGTPVPIFRDDQHYPFRVEPLFAQWAPLTAHPGSAVVYRPGRAPVLLVLQEDDFWEQAAPIPRGRWREHVDLRVVATRSALRRHLPRAGRIAALGPPAQWDTLPDGAVRNPARLWTWLDYQRAAKTPWEVDCIRAATRFALAGHEAAAAAFAAGASEFEIGLAFGRAAGQMDAELPYPAIVALNANGATLHYQHRDRRRPNAASHHSLLIDAGCSALGYACDITRTHAARAGEFAAMIADLDAIQQQLCRDVAPGASFADLQLRAHELIAGLLAEWGLVRLPAERIIETRLTERFFPHGLGHLLGLQVHDVGGSLAGPRGGELPRPRRFRRLRLTRRLEAQQVLTIEPGVYFIDSLLRRLRREAPRGAINWRRIEALRKYGGIRIEDNVLVTPNGAVNLTRSEHAAAAAA